MIFYRNTYYTDGGNSAGYSWHTSLREARKFAADAVENDPQEYEVSPKPIPEKISIKPTRAGILAALKRYAEAANNG